MKRPSGDCRRKWNPCSRKARNRVQRITSAPVMAFLNSLALVTDMDLPHPSRFARHPPL